MRAARSPTTQSMRRNHLREDVHLRSAASASRNAIVEPTFAGPRTSHRASAQPSSLLARLTLRTQLLMIAGMLSGVMLLLAGISIWGSQRIVEGLQSVYEDRAIPLSKLNVIARILTRQRAMVLATIAAPNDIMFEQLRNEVAESRREIPAAWQAYAGRTMDPDESRLASAFEKLYHALDANALATILLQLEQGQTIHADVTAQQQYLPASKETDKALDALIARQLEQASADYVGARRLSRIIAWTIAAVAASALAIGCLLAIVLARRIVHALGGEPAYAAAMAAEIARGDLTAAIDTRNARPDSLLAAMERMRENLLTAMKAVHAAANTVAAGSRDIASGNADLSARTEEQASSLEETASSMEELTTTVKANADHAKHANELVLAASAAAGKGGKVVADVVKTIGDINESSKKIVEIIGMVDSIAFQTNILALNAAVEAARAGDGGRGFAVVAGEVRMLAQKSATAAKEIAQLIVASARSVERGGRLADAAGKSMNEIVTAMQHATTIVAEISLSSSEQSQGIEQVHRAIGAMDEATQQNAALVGQVSVAADSLQQQAQRLTEAVAAFHL